MTKKIIATFFAIALFAGAAVYAQEPDKGESQENKFSEQKANMLKELTAEKAGIEQVYSCTNSAQKQEDLKKCFEIRKANMEKMHAERRAMRKERLQNAIKKIEEEEKTPKKD